MRNKENARALLKERNYLEQEWSHDQVLMVKVIFED